MTKGILLLAIYISIGFTQNLSYIDGYITDEDGNSMQGVKIEFSNGGGSAITDSDGHYYKFITYGWIGTATPSRNAYTFSPEFRLYSPITKDKRNQNYTGSSIYARFDGFIRDCSGQGLEGVRIDYTNGAGSVMTGEDGRYFNFITKGWSGSATPYKEGFTFKPAVRNYTRNTVDRKNQNFSISNTQYDEYSCVYVGGYIRDDNFNGVADVTLSFGDFYEPVTTNEDGYYRSKNIRKGWIGTVTPSKIDFTFSPESRLYSPLDSYRINQNYSALSKYVSVSGWIRDSWNNPIYGVAVTFSESGDVAWTDGIGYYQKFLLRGVETIATPSKQNYTFDPPSRTHSMNGDSDDQSYKAFSTLSAESLDDVINEFTLFSAYPNPFNPSTTIKYGLAHEDHVSIEIYDISGNHIRTLFAGKQTKGWHLVNWDGTNQNNILSPAGLYLAKISAGNKVKTQKLMLLK